MRPDGFIDVVAAFNPIAKDDHETPAHWSVTFAADDVDATAAKVERAWRRGRAGPVRCALDQVGGDQGPAGSNLHRWPVRAGEQGPHDVAGDRVVVSSTDRAATLTNASGPTSLEFPDRRIVAGTAFDFEPFGA